MFAMTMIFLAIGASAANASLDITQTDLGAQVRFTVSVSSVTSTINSFGFDVLYDYNSLNYTGTNTPGPLSSYVDNFGVNEPEQGRLRIGGFGGSIPQGQSGILVTLLFDKVAEITTYPASFANLLDDIEAYPTNPSGTPPIVWSGQVFYVFENTPDGTPFAQIIAMDGDQEVLDFGITGGDTMNAFYIDTRGRILVNDETQIDYGATPSYALSIEVSDGRDTTPATITVNILPFPADLNDDLAIDLQDAILALQVVAGINADVFTHGGKAGLREALFVLQIASELRN